MKNAKDNISRRLLITNDYTLGERNSNKNSLFVERCVLSVHE